MGYVERELWVERRDPIDERGQIRLFGVLRVPAGLTGPLPAVVLSHGFTANHEECDPYARALSEAGIVTLALDFFGGGAAIRSDGTLLDMTVETEAEDLLSFVEAVRALDEVDARDVSLLGCSQGGFVSTMVASRLGSRIRRLCLMYPAYVLHDDALALFERPEDVPESYCAFEGYEPSRVSRDYNLVARASDPYAMMPDYPGEVLIVAGDADVVVPLSYARRAQRTFPHAELVVLEGAGHGFGDRIEQAARLAVDFLAHRG